MAASVLVNLPETLGLMIDHRDMIASELSGGRPQLMPSPPRFLDLGAISLALY
jgi:hypothetical protein